MMHAPTEIAESVLSEETVIRLFSDGSAILEFVESRDTGDDIVFAQLTPAEVRALRVALVRSSTGDDHE